MSSINIIIIVIIIIILIYLFFSFQNSKGPHCGHRITINFKIKKGFDSYPTGGPNVAPYYICGQQYTPAYRQQYIPAYGQQPQCVVGVAPQVIRASPSGAMVVRPSAVQTAGLGTPVGIAAAGPLTAGPPSAGQPT